MSRDQRLTVECRAGNMVMEALWQWSIGDPDRVATLHLDGTAHLANWIDVIPGEHAGPADVVAAWDPPANNLSRDQLGDAAWSDQDIDIATDWLLTEWLTAWEDAAAERRRQRARAALCQECPAAHRP